MGTKYPKEKNKENISNKKTTPLKQQESHPTSKTSRSNGWFTEKDAKIIKEEVIGKFYST